MDANPPLGNSRAVAPKPVVYAVDDEVFNVDLIARSLPECSVSKFADSRAALAAARNERPTLLLIDYRMPHLNGVELIRALHQSGIDCAAILVTAYADFEEVVAAKRESTLVTIVAKPFRPHDLRAQVHIALKMQELRARVRRP